MVVVVVVAYVSCSHVVITVYNDGLVTVDLQHHTDNADKYGTVVSMFHPFMFLLRLTQLNAHRCIVELQMMCYAVWFFLLKLFTPMPSVL